MAEQELRQVEPLLFVHVHRDALAVIEDANAALFRVYPHLDRCHIRITNHTHTHTPMLVRCNVLSLEWGVCKENYVAYRCLLSAAFTRISSNIL